MRPRFICDEDVGLDEDGRQEHNPSVIIVRLAADPGTGARQVLEAHPFASARVICVPRFAEAHVHLHIQEAVFIDPGAMLRLRIEFHEAGAVHCNAQDDLVQDLGAFGKPPDGKPGKGFLGARPRTLEER